MLMLGLVLALQSAFFLKFEKIGNNQPCKQSQGSAEVCTEVCAKYCLSSGRSIYRTVGVLWGASCQSGDTSYFPQSICVLQILPIGNLCYYRDTLAELGGSGVFWEAYTIGLYSIFIFL